MPANDTLQRYRLQSAEEHFDTGVISDCQQVLIGIQLPDVVIVFFSPNGVLTDLSLVPLNTPLPSSSLEEADEALIHWKSETGFRRTTITIAPFFIPDRCIGIMDIPEHYQEVLDHPEYFEEARRKELFSDIKQWRERGDFVLVWDEDYYFDKEGELLSS